MEDTKEEPLEEFEKNNITTALIGVASIYPELGIFNFGNVLVQKSYSKIDGVRVISGGSSGFEPLYAGFVGRGMLTAAIQGDLYKAPTSNVILRTLRELNYNHMRGILIIIQGNSGDTLNFGLAVSRAELEKIRVKMLVVTEDCVNGQLPKHKKRGLCGVLLVQKIASAMSERGEILKDVYTTCSKIMENIGTAIICKGDFTPQTPEKCICKKTTFGLDAELGRGLQGEGGVKKIETASMAGICSELLKEIFNEGKISLKPGDAIAIMLNNIGKITKMEEWTLVRELVGYFQRISVFVVKLYTGSFMTAAFYEGISLTILKVFDPQIILYLNHPCNAPAWVAMEQQIDSLNTDNIFVMGILRRKNRLAPVVQGPALPVALGNIMLVCTTFACDALVSCERQLNLVDAERGDGDTGTRFKQACTVILNRLRDNKINIKYPFCFFESLSRILQAKVGGTIGCIYSILFGSMANTFGDFSETDQVTPAMWLKALQTALQDFQKYSGCIEYGDHTMFDPLFMCVSTFEKDLKRGVRFVEALGNGVVRAETAVQETRHPRCRYPDSGAHAVGIWLRAVYEGIKLRC